MVLLHACGGVQPHEDAWARWFADHGYLALVVDSFGPRGARNVCAGGDPTMRTRAFDAYGALAYLRSRPDVLPERVGAIGWSHGGGTVLWLDNAAFLAQLGARAPGGGAFRAAIALYPPCQNFRGLKETTAPLLLLAGSADDWTPPAACETAASDLAGAAYPITSHVYDGATHGWDNPADRGVVHIGIHYYTMTYNATATADTQHRIADFLAAALK
jgi:dienelactone hydrolase